MLRSPAAALLVLTLINLFNYIDRFVFSAVKPRIKDELLLSDWEMGLLTSSFIWVYMLTSPFFGRLGDKRSRPHLVAAGVGVWSLATAGAGLARSFAQMFASRAAVGVGEAAYGAISPALLADNFEKVKRGRVFAIFFSAIPIGAALGFVLGGLVEKAYGWRAAFLVAGLPGLLLAAIALALREPPRGEHDPDDPRTGSHALPAGASARAAYATLLRNRDYVLCVLGYAAYTFALGGLADIMPTFLERVRSVDLDRANLVLGGITVVAGFLGTFTGGWLGDRLVARGRKGAYLYVSGVATAIAIPGAVLSLTAAQPEVFYPAFFVTEFFLFVSTSPINAVIVNVVPVNLRATATALSILAIHLLGDAISPPLIGLASDLLGGGARGLATAVLMTPVAIAISAAIWLYAAAKRRADPDPAPAPAAAA